MGQTSMVNFIREMIEIFRHDINMKVPENLHTCQFLFVYMINIFVISLSVIHYNVFNCFICLCAQIKSPTFIYDASIN